MPIKEEVQQLSTETEEVPIMRTTEEEEEVIILQKVEEMQKMQKIWTKRRKLPSLLLCKC